MAPKTERMKVEVTDSLEGETRTFKIILRAPNSDFQLADLLRQRGVISPLDGDLKQAVKVATQIYLAAAEALISSLTTAGAATPKTSSNRTRQARNATRTSQNLGSASELQRGSTAGSN
jgi:hypothetical protein